MATEFRSAIQSWFRGQVDEMTDGIKTVVKDAGEKGDEITRHHIETRGTAKSGKRGRIETGAMLNSVSHDTVEETDTKITMRFGYLHAPDYTEFQEDGFDHVGGVTVEGMYALHDAAEEVFTDLRQDLDKVLK